MRGYYKLFVLITTISVFTTNINAQQITYNDSWGSHGFSLLEDDGNTIRINYSLAEFYLEDLDLDGEQLKSVKVAGIFLPNNEGAPDLAGTGKYVAIPQGAKVSYTIIASRTEKIENVDIAPAPRIPLDTEDGPLHYEKNTKIYSKNAYYPANNVRIKPSKIRGVDVVLVGITPFQYNPVTKELIVYRDLQVELNIAGGTGHIGDDRLRSRWWDPIIHNAVLNPNSIPVMDYGLKSKSSKDDEFEYLIIIPDDATFMSYANQIKDWRNLQGIITGVLTTNDIGGNTTSAIENFVDNAYNTWTIPPVAVLLLGDYGASGNTVMSSADITHPYSGTYVTDNVFADVTGDGLPEIAFARMTAQNSTHLDNMITKFLNYEQLPPTDANFYNNPISALGWQDDRWFQICSEVVGGFWNNELGKNTVRINALGSPANNYTTGPWSTATNTSTVLNYFGPDGLGYIPGTPQELGGFAGGNATDVNNAINSGAFILQHRDHGGESGWGEPAYSTSNLSGLGNNDPIFVMSINCLTGRFDYGSEVFAEAFHRMEYGALGLIAASQVSYSFVNDAYVWGLYDYMWPDFDPGYGSSGDPSVLPCFGNASAKYYLQASSWPYNTGSKAITYDLFHHHGDAFSTVYSEVPQLLSVAHNPTVLAGATSFTVTANNGSFIALTVDGNIIGRADGTGAPVAIPIIPQDVGAEMIVTITKQNYYRYSSSPLNVISPSGPYVVYDSHTINDATGNGNGEADYDENILLNMTVENVGSEPAYNVTATLICSDPYIIIIDNTEPYGTISSGATPTINNAFSFIIADDIPDQHEISFELEMDGNADAIWTSPFTIVVNAPVLETGSLTINDGNGKLDPGETVDIIIETSNTGHSDSPIATGTLTSSSPYITINNGSFDFGTIATGATELATFNITVSGTAPPGTIANFDYDVVAGNYSSSDSYDEVIGQIPVLILDLDPDTPTGLSIGTAIFNNGVSYEYHTVFPADLNLYRSIFVCLGIYSNNYVLSSSEGIILADYLNNGGNLYMEGGDTWAWDLQTTAHTMFNIDGYLDGTGDMSTVAGQPGTFTEGMSFSYSGENNYMDHLNPLSPAFLILENQSPVYGTAMAYDAGTYKTIGSSHDFAGLDDGTSPSTKDELMYEYLKFFGLIGTAVNLTAFLEGPFLSTEMTTDLNLADYLPLSQPYNGLPWNHSGTDPVTSIPNNDVVDWVLVELRETAGDASTATPATSIAQKAGFILKDGSIVDTDGTSSLRFDITVSDNLFAIVYHRNHLGIMSAYPLSLIGDFYTCDFTTGIGQVFGDFNGHKEVVPGIWGMASGDADADREVDNKDKNDIWKIQMGSTGYYNGDFDMNGQVEMSDKTAKWKSNTGNCSFIVK